MNVKNMAAKTPEEKKDNKIDINESLAVVERFDKIIAILESIDNKIETLTKSAESSSAFCKILIGFSITISLIIIGILSILF